MGSIELEGMILEAEAQAAFTGTAKGKWKFECARCLKPLEQAWSARIEALAPIDGGSMDLTEEVRQSISLAQPMKILCTRDCKGLCEICKKNRNEDDCGHLGEAAIDPSPAERIK